MTKEFEINGHKLEAWTPEENPVKFAAILAECERRNEANPELIRINRNTWVRRSQAKENDFRRAEEFKSKSGAVVPPAAPAA